MDLIKRSCIAVKELYEKLKDKGEVGLSPNYSKLYDCKKDLINNMCSPGERAAYAQKFDSLYYTDSDERKFSMMSKPSNVGYFVDYILEDYDTYIEQVEWCLEKKDGQFQRSRLMTNSCRKRALTNINRKCRRSNYTCTASYLEKVSLIAW